MAELEPGQKLRLALAVLLVVGGLGWWVVSPASRGEYEVPRERIDEAAKGRVNERRYAKEGEGGSLGTTVEPPGGADQERLGLARPEPPVITEEMKAKGIGPMGTDRVH
ncbi:MAG: hypothetical protein HZB16_04445 [Armatimonadetes bacterium]|nr:hypothetical protein [Armatimonadota bacterium]